MIYCIAHAKVIDHFDEQGVQTVGSTDEAEVFDRGAQIVSARKADVDGHVPEILIQDAFDEAGRLPPSLPVFWCD